MGLDIEIIQRKKVICPKCGEIVGHSDVRSIDSGGRWWYPFLESIGYYVPHDQRTEENDWYGKDMVLTMEQSNELYRFIGTEHLCYNGDEIKQLVAIAQYENDDIVINADW